MRLSAEVRVPEILIKILQVLGVHPESIGGVVIRGGVNGLKMNLLRGLEPWGKPFAVQHCVRDLYRYRLCVIL